MYARRSYKALRDRERESEKGVSSFFFRAALRSFCARQSDPGGASPGTCSAARVSLAVARGRTRPLRAPHTTHGLRCGQARQRLSLTVLAKLEVTRDEPPMGDGGEPTVDAVASTRR